ncbi:MAG: hypothetical protein ACTSU8_05105, partial [Alphaproteobacteria bacterium]
SAIPEINIVRDSQVETVPSPTPVKFIKPNQTNNNAKPILAKRTALSSFIKLKILSMKISPV